MTVHRVKISRNLAGKKFPFDYLYLVKLEDKAHIASMFQYSIVMPVLEEMEYFLKNIRLETATKISHVRGVETTAMSQRKNSSLGTLIDFSQKWLAVIPLLPKIRSAKAGQTRNANYITAAGWLRYNTVTVPKVKGSKASKMSAGKRLLQAFDGQAVTDPENPAFNAQAYLQTPEKAIRPPCKMCPRVILHRAGSCNLGDAICYQELPLGIQEAAMKEEEFEEMTHE